MSNRIFLVLIIFNCHTLITMELDLYNKKNKFLEKSLLSTLNFISEIKSQEIQQETGSHFLKYQEWWFADKSIIYKSAINCVHFNPNKKYQQYLAIANKKNVTIYDINTDKNIISLHHNAIVNLVRFSRSGNYLVTTSDDSCARLFTLPCRSKKNSSKKTNCLSFIFKFEDKPLITSACFSNDEKYLIIGSKHSECHIFDIETGKKIKTINIQDGVAVCCTDQKNNIVTGSMSPYVHITPLNVSKESTNSSELPSELSFNNWTYAIDYDHSKNLLLTGSDDDYVRIINMNSRQIISLIPHESSIRSICSHARKEVFATGTIKGKTRIINIATLQEVASFTSHVANPDIHCNIRYLSFNYAGNLLAIGFENNKINIFRQYQNWTLEQLYLKMIFNTWLLIEKPNKKIKTISKLFIDIAQKFSIKNELKLTKQKLKIIWSTFPKNIQTSILRTMFYKIQLYGKKLKTIKKKISFCK